jgi:CubicO group peptidase (beta-lactamase class C family)
MLTHSSGMAYFFMDPVMTRYYELQGKPPVLQTLFQFQFLLFEPGERWMYSPGIDWAGKAVSPGMFGRPHHDKLTMSDVKRLSESLP